VLHAALVTVVQQWSRDCFGQAKPSGNLAKNDDATI
jgi:hypothetical protein